jgi:hypothetical protein
MLEPLKSASVIPKRQLTGCRGSIRSAERPRRSNGAQQRIEPWMPSQWHKQSIYRN